MSKVYNGINRTKSFLCGSLIGTVYIVILYSVVSYCFSENPVFDVYDANTEVLNLPAIIMVHKGVDALEQERSENRAIRSPIDTNSMDLMVEKIWQKQSARKGQANLE